MSRQTEPGDYPIPTNNNRLTLDTKFSTDCHVNFSIYEFGLDTVINGSLLYSVEFDEVF